ncbi:accessory Sec system glycosylation chaperone GtfB [Enterococcus mundtii]|uniref:UDP-N-acetylglucosamine--peptide N-acetylglucosaminyltransferase stabilizing protein GtfB n=1 Tax=Enterococcus mundtii TaxID=53346 RepID=A0A242KUC0_ENTMU|nr:accessory Sec system glycosylation chaperone GtfB [Enterococcus mundtii]OTP24834.1 accessory Sec system glycosyltransferase GTFB [Enterococcus mundtii]
MINLFEDYTDYSVDLENSLVASGYKHQTVVLKDDGYLPTHVLSPIKFFIGNLDGTEKIPKFFNEVKIPEYWEIKGNNLSAEIFEGYRKKGKINYSIREEDFRAIKSVEWLNDQGRIRSVDLYNQYGVFFGRKTYSDGMLTLTTYLDTEQREVILMNHVTHTIQLYYQGKRYFFENFNEFILFFFEEAQLDVTEIFYNNLGTPFFLTSALQKKYPKKYYNHTLFWQEESETVPQNMKFLFGGTTATRRIIVQNREEYLRINQQIADMTTEIPIDYLGMLYKFKRAPELNQSILIVTASDKIAHLQELVKALPMCEFHIAARTTMSSQLLAFDRFSNVFLYPAIEDEMLEFLLNQCSVYLDINQGKEVEQIIRKAFEHHQLILGFEETVHNNRFINKKHIFRFDQASEFIHAIVQVMKNSELYGQAIGSQLWYAGQSTVSEYKEMLG